MNLYAYNKGTGEFRGVMKAFIDPLLSEKEGRDIYNIPPNCTTKELPLVDLKENEVLRFNNGDWEITKDYRGSYVYNEKTGEALLIKELGDIPKGYSLTKPVDLQEEKIKKVEELKTLYSKALEEKIKIKGIEVKVEDRFELTRILQTLGSIKYAVIPTDEGFTKLNKEELEEIIKALVVRSLVLPIRRAKLLNEIKKAKDVSEVLNIKLDFNISEKVSELVKLSDEEINKYVEEQSK